MQHAILTLVHVDSMELLRHRFFSHLDHMHTFYILYTPFVTLASCRSWHTCSRASPRLSQVSCSSPPAPAPAQSDPEAAWPVR